MAYSQQQNPQYMQQQQYYSSQPQSHRAVERKQQAYAPQPRHDDTYDIYGQYDDSNLAAASSYDQYGGNPYAVGPVPTKFQANDPRVAPDTGYLHAAEGYVNGYDGQSVPQAMRIQHPQRPLPNNQRIPPAPNSGANYPSQQPQNGWQGRPGGPPMAGRMPGPSYAPGMRNNLPVQGDPNRSRTMPSGVQYDYGRPEPNRIPQFAAPYASQDSRARSGSNNIRPRFDGPSQAGRGVQQPPDRPQQERRMPDRQAFAGPKSPETRNFDNPFPAFSSMKKAATFHGNTPEDMQKPSDSGRFSQEIYNGIVGDYAGDEQQPRIPADSYRNDYEGQDVPSNSPPRQQRPNAYNEQDSRRAQPPGPQSRLPREGFPTPSHPNQRQPRPDFRNPVKPPGWNNNTNGVPAMRPGNNAQFSLPERPGMAPSASMGQSGNVDPDPRFRDPRTRPPPDRSRSDHSRDQVVPPRQDEGMYSLPSASNGPGNGRMADSRNNVSYGDGHTDNYDRRGPDITDQYPPRGLQNHQPNYSDPMATRVTPAQWQQPHIQGREIERTNLSQNGVTQRIAGPESMRPPMDDGRRPERNGHPAFTRGRVPASDPRDPAPPQFTKLDRSFTNEGQPATSSPRFIPAQVAPRQQSPMRRPSPPANGLPPSMNGSQPTGPYGGQYSHSFEQLPRPSMDRADGSSTSIMSSKRANAGLPNRNNVERPTFYPATGKITHSPPVSFAQSSSQPQTPHTSGLPNDRDTAVRNHPQTQPTQERKNPDALPHHATPITQVSQPNETATQTPPRPPPVRQYQTEGQPPASSAITARKSSVPVTQEELSRLREIVRTNPSDTTAQLMLAKKLGAVAKSSADGTVTGGLRVNAKDQERYNSEAYKLVKKLVSNENMDAMFYLAECYGDGTLGLPSNPKEAFTNYQSAAKLGHSAAAYRTAVCCEIGPEEGGGTRKDLQKALQWYKRASALGDVPATYKMGIILLKGLLGQEKSTGEAVGYLKRAAERADEENPHALHELGLLYESPKNPGLIVRDEAQAFSLFAKAAKLGYKFSQFKLGQAYEYGLLGCKVEARNSIIWYTKAAAQGEHQSELALSGWYLTGSEGILEHSDTEAYLWARKAALAEPPLPKAMFAMGYFTEVGIGCPRSLEEAKRWYGRAAAYKFPKAQEHLEELQRGGSKAQKNREKLSRNNPKHEAECGVM